MYRQIFTAPKSDITITVPLSWSGQNVEVIAFPLSNVPDKTKQSSIAERRRQREEMNKKYSFSTKNFKFNRDEANDYD